jgi:hypothetical protein
MEHGDAILTLLASAIVMLVVAGPARRRLPRIAVDGVSALAGAGLGVGGLLLLDDVGAASWIVGPLVLAVMAPLHVRALFAGAGPFRT